MDEGSTTMMTMEKPPAVETTPTPEPQPSGWTPGKTAIVVLGLLAALGAGTMIASTGSGSTPAPGVKTIQPADEEAPVPQAPVVVAPTTAPAAAPQAAPQPTATTSAAVPAVQAPQAPVAVTPTTLCCQGPQKSTPTTK